MANALQKIPSAGASFEPRAKLLATLSAFILLIASQSIPILAGAVGYILVICFLVRMPWIWTLNRVLLVWLAALPFLLFAPFWITEGRKLAEVWGLAVYEGGMKFSLVLVLRTTGISLWALFILATTSWTQGIQAAQKLGMPRKLGAILLLTHRYIFLMNAELDRIKVAVRIRGFRNRMNLHSQKTIGHLLGFLFQQGFQRSETLHQALMVRGFNGQLPSLRTPVMKTKDWVFLTFSILLHSALLAGDWMGR
ncbi:cobalt ECF transporter T component CbiQ [Telmatocola sphagniphila]|uniref:Cobalt ECF transporter T component CbiQ n=1 Tax=Telmatocola sphagniphila TaxID=1123043 RepID=A0A8E6EVL3_9BACT|nr:cobalt ECF transporter T component CbiQ [Telmatocola sphagniphila]QVL32890.1 cobalt ECF transporter T component CbiQ [Telmatocola sphagniphila]